MGTAKRQRQRTNRQHARQQHARLQARRQQKRRFAVIGGFIVAFVAAAAVIAVTTSGGDDDEENTAGNTTTVAGATTVPGATTAPATTLPPTPCPAADGSSPKTQVFSQPPQTCIDPAKSYTATFGTSKGSFSVALDPTTAPVGVNNFVVLSRYHYYEGTTCHRIIAGYMAQCGDPAGTGSGTNPGYGIAEEKPADVSAYKPGTLAMANAGPGTTGGQFFVMIGQGPPPPTPDYTILGQVTEGFDTTVKAIEAAADPNGTDGVPTLETITINSVTITEA